MSPASDTSPTVKLDLWPQALPATPEAIRAALFGTLPKARGNVIVLDRNNSEALDVRYLAKRYFVRQVSYTPPSRVVKQAKLAVATDFTRDARRRSFRLLPRKDETFPFDETLMILLAFADGAAADFPHKWVSTR